MNRLNVGIAQISKGLVIDPASVTISTYLSGLFTI